MHPAPSLVDALARLADDQDQDSWAVVLELAGPDCWRCCRAVMGNSGEAEDAFHETLMQIRDDAGQFRPRTDQPQEDARRWVCRVATTTALMMRRSRARAIARDKDAGRMQDTRSIPDPATDLADQEVLHDFRDALCALKEPRRTVIAMHHLQGIPVPDIAIELGRPQGTIKTWIHRGLAELRARMGTRGHVMSVAGLVALGSQMHTASVGSALPAAALHHAAALLTNGSKPTVHALALTSSGALTMKIKIAGIIILAGVTLGGMTGLLGQDLPQPKEVTELPQVMPAGTEQEIDAVIEKAIAAGLPDAKGGRLFRGKIVATPPGAAPVAAGFLGKTHVFAGVHLQLADGTWVINLAYPLPSSRGWSIDATALTELPVDKLVTTAQQLLNPKWKTMEKGDPWSTDALVQKFDPDQKIMARALYDDFAPVQRLLQGTATADDPVRFSPLRDDALAVQTAFLVRLGLPHAEQMAVLCTGHVQSEDELVAPIRDAAAARLSLFRLESGLPMYDLCFCSDAKGLQDLGTSYRRLLAVHFYNELTGNISWDGHPELEPEQAARAVLALADAEALVNLRDEVPGLVARRKLAGQAGPGADLATRLALGDTGNEHPDNDGSDSPDADNLLDDYHPYHQAQEVLALSPAQFALLPEYYRQSVLHARDYTAADLDGLVALLGDGRPSRWLDHGRFRTVGDHALRMIAYVLAIDPRLLIGRVEAAPWNAAERADTAAALTTWWRDNRGKSLTQLATPGVDRAPLRQLACLLQRPVSDAQERARQLDLIAAEWARNPPHLADDHQLSSYDLAYVLAAGQGNESISAVVDAWPLAGPCANLLVTRRLARGDSKEFMDFLVKLANPAEVPDAKSSSWELDHLITTTYLRPDQRSIAYFTDLFNGPWEKVEAQMMFKATQYGFMTMRSAEDVMMHLDEIPLQAKLGDGTAKAFAVLPLTLDGSLLKDQRLAPDWMKTWFSVQNGPAPNDLRVCDIAAYKTTGCWVTCRSFMPEMQKELLQLAPVAFKSDLAKRDEGILKLRVLIAKYLPAALKEAHLNVTIPGVTEVSVPGSGL